MERHRVIALLAAVCTVALSAPAHADIVIPTPEQPGPNTKIAIDAVNSAMDTVRDRDHACRVGLAPFDNSPSHDPPPQELLDALAVLRRPATPQDALPGGPAFAPVEGPIAVDYIRRARVLPNRMSVYVAPVLNVSRALAKRPERCFARERLALDHRLRGKPAQAQRAARRFMRTFQRSQRAAARLTPRPGLSVFVEGTNGGFGTDADVTAIRKRGALGATAVPGHRALLVTVVPDGVATIEFEFARGHGIDVDAGGHRFYRHVYRRRVAVVENVAALTVPRLPLDTLFHREVWRAADGSVVNVVAAPTGG